MLKDIQDLLVKLKCRGMESVLESTLTKAKKDKTAITEVLFNLLSAEYQYRKERTLENRLKQSRMPWEWTLDTFPFKKQPSINKAEIMELATLNFMERNENIVFTGRPGTGKTGLAIGLLRIAILNGYRGRFYKAQDLLDELYTSLADRTTARLLKQLSKTELLVIDELGYLTLKDEQVNMFFKLIEMRYRRRPTIITTNLVFEEWYDVFKNKALVDAMLDRYQHYCTAIHIKGKSLREPQKKIDQSAIKRSTKNPTTK